MTYEQYVDAHWARLARFAAVLTGDCALAEDVLQTVLTRAWERWPQVSASTHVHAYVRRMVVNEFVSWNRKWRRVVLVDDLDDLVPPVADASDQHADRVDLLAQLSGCRPSSEQRSCCASTRGSTIPRSPMPSAAPRAPCAATSPAASRPCASATRPT